MSAIGEFHRAKCGVEGKCSVPMWSGGSPDGFCDKPAWGEQYSAGGIHNFRWAKPNRYGFYDGYGQRAPYAPSLCCKDHGGPGPDDIRFVRDGNAWCAFMPDFLNLQESVAGFGATQDQAEAALLAARTSASEQL